MIKLKNNFIKKSIMMCLVGTIVSVLTINSYASSVDNSSEDIFQQKVDELDIRTTEESKSIINDWISEIEENGFKYKVNENLSQDEIDKRYNEISEKYDVFEKLSNEDAEFIVAYKDSFSSIENMNSRAIDVTSTLKTTQRSVGGVTARVSGKIWHKGGSAWSLKNSYGGNVNFNIVGGASKVRKVTGQIRHEAWGVVGENGIVKVYNDKIEVVKTKAPFAKTNLARTEYYTAYVGIMKTYAYMIIDYSGGQFHVAAGK